MRQIYIMVAGLTLLILAAALGCSGTQAKSRLDSEPALDSSSPKALEISAINGNYTVKIGFPTLVKDSVAPDGPDLWAIDQGFFEEEFSRDGIKLEYVPFLGAAPAINEALAAGSLDMAVIADIGALIGKAGGLKTSLLATGNPEGVVWELLVEASSTIRTVNDLKGKKVATVKGTLPHFYLLEALKSHELQSADINLINMSGPDSEQALRGGQIAAAVSGGWKGQQLRTQGFRSIDSTRDTPIGRGTLVIVATEKFIASHPTFFRRYYKVRQQATEWANSNRNRAITTLAKANGGIDPSFEEPLFSNPFNFDQSLNDDILTRIKSVESFLINLGLTKMSVDVDAWVNKDVAYASP